MGKCHTVTYAKRATSVTCTWLQDYGDKMVPKKRKEKKKAPLQCALVNPAPPSVCPSVRPAPLPGVAVRRSCSCCATATEGSCLLLRLTRPPSPREMCGYCSAGQHTWMEASRAWNMQAVRRRRRRGALQLLGIERTSHSPLLDVQSLNSLLSAPRLGPGFN